MPDPTEKPTPGADDAPASPPAFQRATTAPERPKRSKPKQPRLTPLETTTAAPPPARATAGAPATPSPPSAPAPPTLGAGGANQAAATPLSASALGAIAAMAASYGAGPPSADTGQPLTPPTVAADRQPSGPMLIDGHFGSGYAAAAQSASGAGGAMGELNTELGSLLSGATGTTAQGRAAMAAILAEVDAAVTALGTVPDSAAGRQMLINALDSALQRAGTVLGQGQSAHAVTADRVAALADRYLRDSRTRARPAVAYSHAAAGPPLARPSGSEAQWIDQALNVLHSNGYDTSGINPADIAAIIQHESGGNPNAINGWDSNAAAGHPSKGLMQTIDSTFYAHALPGHTDIWNPVDNIIAGVRYAIGRYGSVGNVPGIVRLHEGLSYVGY
jgi:hypothetical protein